MEEFLSLKENGCGHLSVHLRHRQVQVQVGKTVRRLDFLRKEVAIRKVGQAKLDSQGSCCPKPSSPKNSISHTRNLKTNAQDSFKQFHSECFQSRFQKAKTHMHSILQNSKHCTKEQKAPKSTRNSPPTPPNLVGPQRLLSDTSFY